MSAVKLHQQPPFAAFCTLRRSVLTVAIVTLVSFTYLSLKSLHSPSLLSSTTTTSTVQPSLPEDVDYGDTAEGERKESDDAEEGDVYHLPKVFRLNYEEMLKRFKVYVYSDGDPKTYYQTPRKLTGKYASEGYFFQNLRDSKFVTDDPDQADLFFIPISCHKMRGKGISYENMTIIVRDYVEGLMSKYPYWNRTLGADHFFVTCHDVGVRATEGLPNLIKNSIRVVCSPSYDVGFIPHKDVALPQVLQPFALPAGENDIENRTTLAFWAGHRNSKIRVILAQVWENDTELDISNNRINRATGHLVYQKRFYRTKFCICPGGSQVNSARIADSIHYGCIPVLKEKDVYQLKQILKNITQEEFVRLHNNLHKVQKHFHWNSPAVSHDAFHMIMYELWLRHHVIKY
ncbi:probable glycosyltransferase At5g03795 isoform X2 [Salvia hispanica]|uniref:probable glycosyltransferase At5g03795 isoform X2 n=1 Tax=Salvia hispanica TaxID=49212 RepID=UPI002009D8DB|nr:probable glycosyltransferase At5g03795 isoform X2 [Salvia hispanica]